MRLDLIDASRKLGSTLALHSAPGGLDRKTVICELDGRLVAVSQRRSVSRAQMEAAILKSLGPTGLSPRLIHCVDDILVQEYIEGDRLPVALSRAPPALRTELIRRSVEALLRAQGEGDAVGLAQLVPDIGTREGWVEDLAMSAFRLGKLIGLEVPSHDFGDWLDVPPSAHRRFIKWDARPGNFLVRANGTICIIDWEHAGRRRRVDDLAWFFADEWMPEVPDVLEQSLRTMSFNDRSDRVRQQFLALAIAHSCIRLHLILLRKGDGPWWNWQACLQNDRVGVTPFHLRHVARRAANWSDEFAGLEELSGFFEAVPGVLKLD